MQVYSKVIGNGTENKLVMPCLFPDLPGRPDIGFLAFSGTICSYVFALSQVILFLDISLLLCIILNYMVMMPLAGFLIQTCPLEKSHKHMLRLIIWAFQGIVFNHIYGFSLANTGNDLFGYVRW